MWIEVRTVHSLIVVIATATAEGLQLHSPEQAAKDVSSRQISPAVLLYLLLHPYAICIRSYVDMYVSFSCQIKVLTHNMTRLKYCNFFKEMNDQKGWHTQRGRHSPSRKIGRFPLKDRAKIGSTAGANRTRGSPDRRSIQYTIAVLKRFPCELKIYCQDISVLYPIKKLGQGDYLNQLFSYL